MNTQPAKAWTLQRGLSPNVGEDEPLHDLEVTITKEIPYDAD
jgi:hypothetical protein